VTRVLALALLICGTARAAPTIAVIGDSLVEDRVNDPDAWEQLCTLLAGSTCSDTGTILDLGGTGPVYAAGGVTIRNLGDTGDAISDEIFGRYCRHCISPGTAPGEPYGAIVFDGGINDAILGYSAANIWAQWQLMLDDAYNRGKTVIVLYDPPWAGSGAWSAPRDAVLETLWASVVAWCVGKVRAECVDLGATLDVDGNDTCDATFCTDGLHWDAAGSAAVAARLNTGATRTLLLAASP
jgi:hypothetical protein